MIAVLKIGPSPDLVLYENHKVVLSLTLTKDKVLSEAYSYLKDLKVDELRVVVVPTTQTTIPNSEDIGLFTINTPNTSRTGYLSLDDAKQVCGLASVLEIEDVAIYNLFDIFKLMSAKEACIVIGNYSTGGNLYYVYLSGNKIVDIKLSQNINKKNVLDLIARYGTTRIFNENNLELIGKVNNLFLNTSTMEDEQMAQIYPLLCTDLVQPIRFLNVNEILNGTKPNQNTECDLFNEEELYEEVHKFRPKQKKGKYTPSVAKDTEGVSPTILKYTKACKALDIVGCILAVSLAVTLLGNKEMPKNITEANEKITQMEQVVKPKQANIQYLNDFNKKLKNGGVGHAKLVEDIKGIKTDVMFGELVINKNKIDLTVYAKDEEDLDKYKEKVAKYFTVTDITKVSAMEQQDTKLQKYSINGNLK